MALKNSGDFFHVSAISIFDNPDSLEMLWTPWHRLEVFNAIRQAERNGLLQTTNAGAEIRSLENEVRLGYWPHVEFDWFDAVRTANTLSAEHSRNLLIRGMDLFHVAIALEIGAEKFLTFDGDQAVLAEAAGLKTWELQL